MSSFIKCLAPLALGLLFGCGPLDDPSTRATADASEHLTTRDQFIASQRTDRVGMITPSEGYWGEWKQSVYCNPGSWAVGYRMRVEPWQEGGDDTALNSIKLLCKSSQNEFEWISSDDGHWGTWNEYADCSNGAYLSGARLKVEAPAGKGDDTGANSAEFSCSNGRSVVAPGGLDWGTWSEWQTCPAKSAVCGLSIRSEDPLVNGDDTAMNGLRLFCCAKE